MQLQLLTITHFANFTQPISFGPLGDFNAIYGDNNSGKSNLLKAVALYFAVLGAGENTSRLQPQTLDRIEGPLAEYLREAFTWKDPQPIRFEAVWKVQQADLERYGLFPEGAFERIETVLELRLLNRAHEVRVEKWMQGDSDLSVLDKARNSQQVVFASQLRRMLSDAKPFTADRPFFPVRFAGRSTEGFTQALRDGLFDARQSLRSDDRRRWALFAELAGSLKTELGPGRWETTFDRAKGTADVIYLASDESVVRVETMGDGAQRLAGLIAEICLAYEPYLCLEEPEWRLSPALQRRLIAAARRMAESGLGVRQLFASTHSPTMAAQGRAFAMERMEGIPTLEAREWVPAVGESAAGSAVRPEPATPELGSLIGLVEELSEMDPDRLVVEAPRAAVAPQRPASSPFAPGSTPAPQPFAPASQTPPPSSAPGASGTSSPTPPGPVKPGNRPAVPWRPGRS